MVLLAAACGGRVFAGVQTNDVPQAKPQLPCIIIITADGLGPGELGCYGQEIVQTPRIDALAAGGLRFTESYAGGANDESARMALLTGRPSEDAFPSNYRTVAEELKRAGYHTGFIGYWGLGGFNSSGSPQRQGFDEVVVYGDRPHAQDLYTGYLYRRDPRTGFEGRVPLAGNPPGKKETYVPDLLTQAASRFCRYNRPQQLNNYRPFLLLLSYPVPSAVAARGGPVPESNVDAPREWSALQKDKANAIVRLDQHVGEVLDEVEKHGLTQNTIVVFTGSLGPQPKAALDLTSFNRTGPLAQGAPLLSEIRLRVPLIVRWPFWRRAGGVTDLLVAGQDIVPTVLEAAQLELPEGIEGISFLPTLQRQIQTNQHAYLGWEVEDAEGNLHSAVRHESMKCVRYAPDQPWQLYDLASDPGEQMNLAEENPDLVRKLEQLLKTGKRSGRETSGPVSGG